MAERIRKKLQAKFDPQRLDVIDESARHKGHGGARPGGETHFRVVIVAETFRGKSRLERQRAIHAALAGELADGLHALSIAAMTPEEVHT